MELGKSLVGISVASALLAMSGNASASAFALIEQSSGLGNAFAGGAAGAEDATTIFFNPAGMSRLNGRQATVAGSLIKPAGKFTDTGSTGGLYQTPGGNGGDAGGVVLVPNAYMVTEIEPSLRFGLGINVPFGLQTDYDPTWVGRFQAIKSKIQTINLNPSLAYQASDTVSLGIGLNYQHITGELTSAVNYSALGAASGAATGAAQAIAGGATVGSPAYLAAVEAGKAAGLAAAGGENKEGVSSIAGSDSSWGYNLGALFSVTPDTRVGMSYRSKVTYTLKGTVSFTAVPTLMATNSRLQNGDVTLPITMPDTFSISGFHKLNDKWDLMADATRTGWSVLQELKIDRTNGTNVQTVQEKWKNTWRFAVGANHHYNEQWMSRVGVAYDQSPVPDAYRTARIPDNDRSWLSLGGQYKPSASATIDFGYAHLFIKDTTIADKQAASLKGDLVGTYSSSVDILSVQYAYNF